MSLFKEDIDHAADRVTGIFDGGLNKLRSIFHGLLDRVNGTEVDFTLKVRIPPRPETSQTES